MQYKNHCSFCLRDLIIFIKFSVGCAPFTTNSLSKIKQGTPDIPMAFAWFASFSKFLLSSLDKR